MFINRHICRSFLRIFSVRHVRKLCDKSYFPDEPMNYIIFKTGLNSDQQQTVLEILNTAKEEELEKYSLSLTRIKHMKLWRMKNGPFKSLNDILEVEGMGEKSLERLCHKIIGKNVLKNNVNRSSPVFSEKRIKQSAVPLLPEDLTKNLNSLTGIHLSPIGISWAQLASARNELTNWDYVLFTSLPAKSTPIETYNLVYQLVQQIPPSDMYLLENQLSPALNPSNQSQAASYLEQLELSSMMLALLNTSVKHNANMPENRVFHMRNRLPARLFRLIVGAERISSVHTIEQILGREEDRHLPCSPILVDHKFKNEFNRQQPMNKELLGRALLLAICFMDVFVYKNPVSMAVLFSNRTYVK